MIDIDDYKRINNTTKRYRLFCDSCGADRGYGMKSRSHMLCKRCTHIGKCYFDHSSESFRQKMSKAKKGKTPSNKGKSKYTKEQRTLRCNMSAAIRIRLNARGSSKKGQSYLSILGYSIEDLRKHIESQFYTNPRNGILMTWNNWGPWKEDDSTWHIDHIVPDSLFSYSSALDDGFKNSWALSNLRPLWAKDNISKGNKV